MVRGSCFRDGLVLEDKWSALLASIVLFVEQMDDLFLPPSQTQYCVGGNYPFCLMGLCQD